MMTNQDMVNFMLEIGCQQYEICRIVSRLGPKSMKFSFLIVIQLPIFDIKKNQCYRSIIFFTCVGHYRGVIMTSKLKEKSLTMVALMFMSVMLSMISDSISLRCRNKSND